MSMQNVRSYLERHFVSVFAVFVVLATGFSTTSTAQTLGRHQDVVHLKNGSVIRGILLEQVPGESLKIQTENRNIFVFPMNEVERISKEPVPEPIEEPRVPGDKNLLEDAGTSGRIGEQPALRSPGAAFALSFFVPGAGQIYNSVVKPNELVFGFMFFLGTVGPAVITPFCEDVFCIASGALGSGIFWLFNWIHAPIVASDINDREYSIDDISPSYRPQYSAGLERPRFAVLPAIDPSTLGNLQYGLQAAYRF